MPFLFLLLGLEKEERNRDVEEICRKRMSYNIGVSEEKRLVQYIVEGRTPFGLPSQASICFGLLLLSFLKSKHIGPNSD